MTRSACVGLGLFAASAYAQTAVIYEPFNDLDSTLSGNTPGTGLTGTWSGQSLVEGSSLIYGALAYEGGRIVTNPNNQFDRNEVSPGTTLTDAGLMADGATLWFSAVIVNHTSPDTGDERTYVSLGTGVADGFDRIGGNTGHGFTVAVSKVSEGGVTAQAWNANGDGTGGASRGATVAVAEDLPFLAVGKITWGQYNADPMLATPDTFELFLPDENLNMGSAVSTVTGNFDQLGVVDPGNLFDSISVAGGRPVALVPEVDEIRFGASYAEVASADSTAPVLVSTDPADDSTSGVTVQQTATFDEPVFANTGDIRIVNDDANTTTTIPVGDPQIVFDGNDMIITPTTPLLGGTAYHIEIDADAVVNFAGVGYAGIANSTDWNFISDSGPPTVSSITDDVSPLPILINSSLTYTVTFSEAIDTGTVDLSDFANGGTASVTIDSVTATGDPAVFEVGVSTVASGSLILEIVQGAVITDLSANPLDTSVAIPDDTTIDVNDPAVTAASLTTDFQATIASEQHPTYAGEARYYHVSVNENNPGTGSYAATIVGTNDPAPTFVRNYTGPVLSYKFAGGGSGSGVMGVGMSGGDASLIEHTTQDEVYDGFGQQQAKVWNSTDPGADIQTTVADPYAASGDANSGLFRSLGGAVGTVDISGLASGSVHIYYGAFSSTPTVRVTMRDLDNVAADITLADVHLNGDAANRTEYYLAEIDFVTDGFYDVIEYEWLANGVDYSGNGRGIGTVLTGPDAVEATPYADWAALNGVTGGFNGNDDGGSTSNGFEWYYFGTDPQVVNGNGSPITGATKTGTDTFEFTHQRPLVRDDVTDVYEWSSDLSTWTADGVAEGGITVSFVAVGDGAGPDYETVTVTATVSGGTLDKLFVRQELSH